jgi:NAD(P)-dependent dehydrogenase (short-subunit alcohol dehydrogenase family)
MDLELKGRKAIISGANRGIGRVIAAALAAEGVHIAALGRNLPACEEAAAELRARHPGITAVAVKVDLGSRTVDPAVAAAVKALGGASILVIRRAAPTAADSKKFLTKCGAVFQGEATGAAPHDRATVPHLKRSTRAHHQHLRHPRREPESHSMMSGPINFGTLSRPAMANEFGPFGITVNAIAPGSTRTRRWDELVGITARERGLGIEAAEKFLLEEVPLGKVIDPQDVADLAVFLASARARLISGCAINVDGGRTRSI